MEYHVRIFNYWVDTNSKGVLSSSVYLLTYVCILVGEIQCEEMTVVVSAVIGSMLTRISC